MRYLLQDIKRHQQLESDGPLYSSIASSLQDVKDTHNAVQAMQVRMNMVYLE